VRAETARALGGGSSAAAEIPASRLGCRGFVRANRVPRKGFSVVRFEILETVIAELEDRWDTNDDYIDLRSVTVSDVEEIDGVLRDWGLDPDILLPAWKVDVP
jgi:hypothetical protein